MKKILLLGLVALLSGSCQQRVERTEMGKVRELMQNFEQQKMIYRLRQDLKK